MTDKHPKRDFSCPACARSGTLRVTAGMCGACYSRSRRLAHLGRPSGQRLAICTGCSRTRLSVFTKGLCPACYMRARSCAFTCTQCGREVFSQIGFARRGVCPRCYTRGRRVVATCAVCGRTKNTIMYDGGVCDSCHRRQRRSIVTCSACQQTRLMRLTSDGWCAACTQRLRDRAAGVPERRALAPEVRQLEMIARLEPWRRPWVREFIEIAYSDRKTSTQLQVLGAVGRFDRFLSSLNDDDPRTWAAVTQEHVNRYLATTRRYGVEDAKPFFTWLAGRKGLPPLTIPCHGGGLQQLRPLPSGLVRDLFNHWTAPEADPQWALAALLSLVHAVPPGRLRQLRLTDVVGGDDPLQLRNMPPLVEPVQQALARFLDWRQSHYQGPSTFLLVSRGSRFVDRPVSNRVLRERACRNLPTSRMAQAAIRELIEAGADPLDLQAFTGLGVATIDTYLRVFQPRTDVGDATGVLVTVPG